MKNISISFILVSWLCVGNLAHSAYPIENYPQDIREQNYPNTVPMPAPKPPIIQTEQQSKSAPIVITETRTLLPLLICEPKIAKEDQHLVKSCRVDADKIYLTTQSGIELISAKDTHDTDLYLGKHNKAHEIKNVLAEERIKIVLITIKNKRYSMELVVKETPSK